ncbi:919_t:CDS:1, partial [Gigaspora rosea]
CFKDCKIVDEIADLSNIRNWLAKLRNGEITVVKIEGLIRK